MNPDRTDEPKSPPPADGAADAARQGEREPIELQLFVRSVRDYAIFMLDPKGRVKTWNVGAERIKGYTREEILGRHFSAFYPREDVEAGKPDVALGLAEAEGRYEDEGWRVRKDGTRFWASVVITAVRDDAGRLVGFGKVTRALTDHKRAEEAHLRLVQAHEAVRLRDDFLSIAAHELRTPMAAVRLQLQRIAELAPPEPTKKMLDRALRNTDRVVALVNALLDVARITTGRLALLCERCELCAVVRDVVERLEPQATKAGSAVEVRIDGPIEGSWDRLRLEQVVTNLLGNAIRFGAGKPIEIRVGSRGGAATITVVDHGPGIAAKDLDRIFARFERAAPIQNYGGLGLGLFVAREIVEAHGGWIRAESVLGAGATFVVRLPLAPPAPGAEEAA